MSTYTRQIACKQDPEFFKDLCFQSCASSRLCQQELRARWSTKITQAHPLLTAKSVEWLPEDKARCIPSLGHGNLWAQAWVRPKCLHSIASDTRE